MANTATEPTRSASAQGTTKTVVALWESRLDLELPDDFDESNLPPGVLDLVLNTRGETHLVGIEVV